MNLSILLGLRFELMKFYTGGKIKPATAQISIYGHWNPNLVRRRAPSFAWTYNTLQLLVIWNLSGVSYGMVELIC